MLEKNRYECQRCGHVWFSFHPQPLECPKCKQYEWRTPSKKVMNKKAAQAENLPQSPVLGSTPTSMEAIKGESGIS